MNNINLYVPSCTSPKKVSDFFESAYEAKKKVGGVDRVTFDITECKFLNPAMAVAMTASRDLFKSINSELVTKIKLRKDSRANKFAQIFGLVKIEELFRDNYVESLTEHTVQLTKCLNVDDCNDTHNKIMKHVTSRTNCEKSTLASIEYIISEIWDNAGTHGYKCYYDDVYPKPVYILSFSYKDGVEIAILDFGQGIHKSLSTRHKGISANKALEMAIEEKVTGHPDGSPGFGLFSTSELIKSNNGKLDIWSSGRSISITSSGYNLGKGGLNDGTLVYLKVNSNISSEFERIMKGRKVENFLDDHQLI